MSWPRRRYEVGAAVPVVVVFATLYAWAVPTEGPNRSADMFWLAVLFTMPTVLWLVTSWLLVRAWWAGAGTRLSTMDAPGQVLAAAVATLPEPRQRWGEAMLGELAQVRGRSGRWRFALSCARAALSLPQPTRRPVLAIAAAAGVAGAAVAAYPLVGVALPVLRFFASGLVALLGVTVVLAIASPRRVRLPTPAATMLVTGAVAACIAATAIFLAQHPAAAEGFSPGRAAVLAGCFWLAAIPPHRLGSNRPAAHLGVGAAVVFALGSLASALTNREGLPALWLLFGPMLIFAVPAYIAAAAGRSFRVGVQAGIWTAIAVMPLTLALAMVEALRQYAINGTWTFAGDIVSAGFSLGVAFMTFLAIPIIGFPFAVVGATAGAAHRGTPAARPDSASPESAGDSPAPVE